MIRKFDKNNKFVSIFNPKSGFYMRSGIIENDKDTGIDPFMTSFPELLDVGIMGHCVHGASGLCIKSGVQCYQNGLKTKLPNMSFENFKRIVDECKGKTFQFALAAGAMSTNMKILKKYLDIVAKMTLFQTLHLRD